ncbi:hypothetical protein [Ruegeria sp. HKCCSP351]|uniref:hypothetical protein n=1 Tax=Ruegeria sp. HKCCSP351 TaxID=2794832 RepID=UPI001AE7FD08|nr:hypothetical protein [Ruegeria sp. HKCCSP351]
MSDDDLMPLIILGKILFWVLIWYLFWGRKGRTEEPPEPVSSSVNGTMERLGRSFGRTDLPIIGPIIKERKRREEEARRKKAEAEARERAERDRAQKEHDALVERPIPPDIKRDMRAFLEGSFVGEDRSPLAYVGYRVGKTRGLVSRERQRRLDVCFRIEIPSDLDPKYQGWGAPATYQRFRSIEKHLKMLADIRSGRSNQRFAVADWEADRTWFQGEYRELAGLLQRHPPRRYW